MPLRKEDIERIVWLAKFAYSGCGKREFMNIEFSVSEGQNVDEAIKQYVISQNKGEAKSDRIRYISKKKK